MLRHNHEASRQVPLIMRDPGILLKMLPDLYLIRPFTSKTSKLGMGFPTASIGNDAFFCFGYQFNLSMIIKAIQTFVCVQSSCSQS